MKISTREAIRNLTVLPSIYPYFHIYYSIQVKFGVDDLYLVYFFSLCEFRAKQYKEYHAYLILLLLLSSSAAAAALLFFTFMHGI